jgi:hypothetical protein
VASTIGVKQFLREIGPVRSAYRRLWFFYHSAPVQRRVWRVREWVDEHARRQPKPQRNCSVEFTIAGRNDDYEPHWTERLESVLAYNRRIFAGSGVDFRVAFVEWNPPAGRPLLGPMLAEKYPFLRAIVAAREVHAELCESKSLAMMLNFSLNAAMRTSESDFIVISGGDVFFGRDVARQLARRGLRLNCLYRAVRVDVKSDLDFARPQAEVLENPQNATRVNEVDAPPYTNACGDFILMDRHSMQRIRGFDENIRGARLHLDSRCCMSALALGLRCRLIGHVYHIDHTRSFVNLGERYPGESPDVHASIPYRNPDNWGLRDRLWEQKGERLFYVS